MRMLLVLASSVLIILSSETVFAGRPLITDDADTQGKGKYLLEVAGEYAHDEDGDIKANRTTFFAELDYGLTDNFDLTVSSAYQAIQFNNAGITGSSEGTADSLVELKWRFYENKSGLRIAIKPGILMPTGNHTKGFGSGDYRLGSGEVRYRLYYVATQDFDKSVFHLNLGYLRNENRYEARDNLWHASFASEWKVSKRLRLVGNIGIDTAPDRGSSIDAVWILGGFIYSFSESFSVNLGAKHSINDPGYDIAITGGISVRF